MKEEQYDNLLEEKKEEEQNMQEILFKYIIRWPWFLTSVCICVICAWFYLHYATPIYNISASIIVKDDKRGGNIGSDFSVFGDMGLINTSKNIDNEIEILRSKSLIKDVINELGLYIKCLLEDGFHTTDLYGESPIQVDFSSEEAERLEDPITLTLHLSTKGELDVKAELNDTLVYNKKFDKLPAGLSTEAGIITFLPNPDQPLLQDADLKVVIQSPLSVTKSFVEALSIEPTSKTTSVATISFKNSSPKRGEDFINKLIELYNRNSNNDKNEIALNTANFIDERIAFISHELGSTEQELEDFKRNAGLTNLSNDAQLAMQERSEYEKLCVENGTQLSLLKSLTEYLNKADNSTVLPTNIGLNDNALNNLIAEYNKLILERNRLLRTSSESNPVIQRLDVSIHDMRTNLATTFASVRKGLLITQADLDKQASKFAGRISNAPTQERQFVSIQRQQEIKAGLYLMLLQKREENNITLAATANNAKIIDDAIANDNPVSPKKKIIYLLALALGFGIPVGIIYVLNLLSFRIEGRADVERLTKVPIIGDVPLTENGKAYEIVVHENENDMMDEIFRNMRTNLLFIIGDPDKKVILVTSTMSGEGKTFVASNLAVSLALLGKKVILLGFDIRKPGLNKVFHIPFKDRGITQFLAAPRSTDLRTLIQPSQVTSNLDIIPGGPVPPNPTELVARPALEELIDKLKETYDYIVMDTAPIGMVTDTRVLARIADASIYVCRADYTHKNDYQLINELYAHNTLPNLCTVINGLDMKKKKYGYYYGYGKYGKYYGYGRKYGYGYGYGYGQEKESEK